MAVSFQVPGPESYVVRSNNDVE